MAREELRRQVISLHKQVTAVLFFTHQFRSDVRQHLTTFKDEIAQASSKRLRDKRDELREDLKRAVQLCGCRAKPQDLSDTLNELMEEGKPLWYMTRSELEKLFSNFKVTFPILRRVPPHTLVAFDLTGRSFVPGSSHWNLPEASLYEDMCIAYNNALNAHREPYGEPSPLLRDKIQAKTYDMFERTALLSAFYFVEAYLNGIAFDFLYSPKRKLSEKEREILTEWNPQKNCESHQSFRTKILHTRK